MSPSCTIKSKQSLDQQKTKSKYHKNKQKQSMATTETKLENDDNVYIELDMKCSCPQSTLNNHSSVQFSRRYLQCQSSMPVGILRSYIQQILPHSSMTQVTLFDQHDQSLNDSQLVRSLTTTSSSITKTSPDHDHNITHIPIRFTLLNTITSLSHCTCSSSYASTEQNVRLSKHSSSANVSVIKRESIDQTLSTCLLIPAVVCSPCLSSSSSSSTIPNGELSESISVSVINLLTPPSSCHSSFLIEDLVESNQSIIDEITSKFGEICPPLPSSRKKNRNRLSKKIMMMSLSSNMPLDLSLKKRPLPSSYDVYSSQAKWIKT